MHMRDGVTQPCANLCSHQLTHASMRRENDYEQYGMRRTVEGIMLVHEHGHPHVLLLQVGQAFFKLPGDYLKPHESDEEGLKARMHLRLGPEPSTAEGVADNDMNGDGAESGGPHEWEVSDVIGHFWRPNFESFMVRPRCPPSAFLVTVRRVPLEGRLGL